MKRKSSISQRRMRYKNRFRASLARVGFVRISMHPETWSNEKIAQGTKVLHYVIGFKNILLRMPDYPKMNHLVWSVTNIKY